MNSLRSKNSLTPTPNKFEKLAYRMFIWSIFENKILQRKNSIFNKKWIIFINNDTYNKGYK